MDILKKIQQFYKYKHGINVTCKEDTMWSGLIGNDGGFCFVTRMNGEERELLYISNAQISDYSTLTSRGLDEILDELVRLSKYGNFKYTKNDKTYNTNFISMFRNYAKYKSSNLNKYERK